ncbi:hypothetical protein WDU94_000125 [Cyamophila willieti]
MIYNFTRYRNLPKHVFSTFRMVRKTSESASSDLNHYQEYGTGVKSNNTLLSPSDTSSIDWIFPVLRQKSSSYLWHWASTVTVAAVGILSKWFLIWSNKVHRHNAHILQEAFDNRPSHVPLITVSNHHSCFDDPGLWVLLKDRQLCSNSRMRWSMAAHDICFTRSSHSYFFMLGKCLPVVRGAGIRMETVLPNEPPYYLRRGKTLTFNVGPPLDLTPTLDKIRANGLSSEEARIMLTELIQDKLYELKRETEELHQEHVKCNDNSKTS